MQQRASAALCAATEGDAIRADSAGIGARAGRAGDAAAVVLLAGLPAFFLKEVPGAVPPYGGDVLVHVYPLLSLLAHALHAGRPALWNFYAAGGYPLAPYSALSFYPPVVAALLALPVTAAIAALYAFYLAVLGLGMYALGADLGLSRPARLLAALTLAYGGFVAAHIYAGHLFELGAICPLPLAFLLLRRAIGAGSTRAALWCGAVVGLMVLAAGVQFLPFALAPLPALALWHLWLRLREPGRSIRRWASPLAALAVAAIVAAALSAVFLLPFREILASTLRAGSVPLGVATAQSLPWGGLVTFVAPNAFGNAAAGSYWPASRFGPYFHEIYAYAGLLPVLLAPIALSRRPAARPYGALGLLALLVMLGGNTPLYGLLYHLPGAQLFRAPARAGFVVDFALAVLAGFGLDALAVRTGPDANAPRRGSAHVGATLARLVAPGSAAALAACVGLSAAALDGLGIPAAGRDVALAAAARLGILLVVSVLALAVAARDRRLVLVAPALALLDLWTANGVLLHPTDPAHFYSAATARRVLPSDVAGYRILARNDAVPPGLGMVTRAYFDTQDFAPLALADYWRLSHPSEVARARGGTVVTGRDRIHDVDPLFLRLFGVRTILSDTPLHGPNLRLIGRVTSPRWMAPGGANWNVYWQRGASLIYRDDAALPRTFVAPRTVRVGNAAAALEALQSGTVDPRRVAVLSPAPAAPPDWLGAIQRDWASWLAGAPENTLSVAADGGRSGGYLLVDDGWYPGWTATVDGRTAPVLRADYLLRAVRLPPGPHQVRLVYAPLTFLLGALITLLTALVLLCAAAWRIGRGLSRTRRFARGS